MGKEAKHVVRLDRGEREELEQILATPRAAAERVLRARVLLKADEGAHGPAWSDTAIAEAFEISVSRVQRLRQRLVDEGLAATLVRHPRPQARPRKLDGVGEARLVTLACSAPPACQARRTLQLLADQLVALQVVDAISGDTVGRTLKKRAQAVARASVGDSAGAQRRVRLRDGRRAGGLPAPLRRDPSSRVPG